MDLMVSISRHAAAVAVRVAAVLLVGAGALVSRILGRQFSRMFVRARAGSTEVEPTPPMRPEPTEPALTSLMQAGLAELPPSPPSQGSQAAEEGSAGNSRSRSFVRRGFTMTVIVLGALGIGTGAWAFHIHPDSAIPQPGTSEIDLIFGPAHLARSPINIDLTLAEDWHVLSSPATAVSLIIDLTGPDLTYPGWELHEQVPSGVQVGTTSDPHALRITHARGQDDVYAAPGAVPRGTFSVELKWYNLDSGPVQVKGANLAAEFPVLLVENQGSPGSANTSLPKLSVSLSRRLQPQGDYAYLAGLPPDHQQPDLPLSVWSWNPVTLQEGYGNASVAAFALPLTVEARSATADEQTRNAEFQSGILFGVAAAALIAAIQEFVNSGRKRDGRQARQSAA
jgi:hypothetical protein